MVRGTNTIMLGFMESKITIEVSDMDEIAKNITKLVSEIEETIVEDEAESETKIITDVWVGIVLSLLILTCTACICSCFLYHRFQRWKRREMEARRLRASANLANVENGDVESLPSYSIVSGLPSYEEALEQLKNVKQACSEDGNQTAATQQPPALSRLSVAELLMIYKQSTQNDKS